MFLGLFHEVLGPTLSIFISQYVGNLYFTPKAPLPLIVDVLTTDLVILTSFSLLQSVSFAIFFPYGLSVIILQGFTVFFGGHLVGAVAYLLKRFVFGSYFEMHYQPRTSKKDSYMQVFSKQLVKVINTEDYVLWVNQVGALAAAAAIARPLSVVVFSALERVGIEKNWGMRGNGALAGGLSTVVFLGVLFSGQRVGTAIVKVAWKRGKVEGERQGEILKKGDTESDEIEV